MTSGNTERYFIVNGKRYGHILNPKTGYPVDECRSVTVLAKSTYLADALATAVFVMGPEKGLAFLESQSHIEGVIVDAAGKVFVSKGLQAGRERQRKL